MVPPARLPYMPGLDGLRAIAVMAVLFYHADFIWARGGFLGVEVFFVISGYLITSLLLLEWLRTGAIDLKTFWLRRARRLLPAVFVLLAGVSLASLLVYRDAADRMLGDVVSAMGYVTNWFLIVRDVSYFESFGRPPLLQHLWSLSVEEQFYVLWPLIFTFGFAIFRHRDAKRTLRSFLALTVVGIIASTVLMGLLYTPFEDPSRVYYGTDTRVSGILVGVALSLFWIPWRLSPTLPKRQAMSLNVIGITSLVVLLVILARMDEFSTFLYQGGFLVTALVTAAVIAATVHPAGVLGTWLENPVMKWIGTRSYGIYLWHWPIFMVTRPGFDVADRPLIVFAVRIALTFGIAEVSYRYVESPIRRNGFRQWVVGLRRAAGISTIRGGSVVAASAMTAIFLLFSGLVWASVSGSPNAITVASEATEDDDLSSVGFGAEQFSLSSTVTSTTAVIRVGELATVTLIGDSVLAGAQAVVEDTLPNDVLIDATVNRQFKHADDVVADLEAAGTLGDVVILHLGTNGAFSSDTFDEVMESLTGVDRVIVLTAKVPRRWEATVNRTITDGGSRWPDVEIVDWHTIGGQHPEWFFEDQVHLNSAGMRAYAELLSETVNDR